MEQEYYPPKPESKPPQDPWVRSLISIVLFAALYYMAFDRKPLYIVILVGVLLFHEMGHFIAMKNYGYQDVKMFFIPFFGAFVSGSKHEISQKERSIILLMGPVPGILLGSAFVGYCYFTEYNRQMMYVANVLIWLNAFNLIPVSPLDGGRLIENLFLSANRVVQIIFISISSIAFLCVSYYLDSWFLMILPYFLFAGLRRTEQINKVRATLDEQQIDYNKPYEALSDREYFFIRNEYIRSLYKGGSLPKEAEEQRYIAGVKSILKERTIYDLSIGGKLLFTFIWLFSLALSIGAILLISHLSYIYMMEH